MKLYHELAEFYFSIENIHRDLSIDTALIRSLLADREKPALLDLGCGTGEHLSPLSRYGVRCVGIDSSEEMLTVARDRFPGRIEFMRGDMRDFDYYGEFDLITSLFGSFNYLLDDPDIEKTLWNAWRALKPEGICLFEIWNSYPVEKIWKKELTHISTVKHNGKTIERNRGFRLLSDPGKTVVEVNYEYIITANGTREVVYDRHTMRTFSREEISKFIEANGFTITGVYANTSKAPFALHSNRMVIFFRKK